MAELTEDQIKEAEKVMHKFYCMMSKSDTFMLSFELMKFSIIIDERGVKFVDNTDVVNVCSHETILFSIQMAKELFPEPHKWKYVLQEVVTCERDKENDPIGVLTRMRKYIELFEAFNTDRIHLGHPMQIFFEFNVG